MMEFKHIALCLLVAAPAACAETPEPGEVEKLLAAGDIAPLVEHARAGGDITPVLEHYARDLGAEAPAEKLGELAQIYHARSQNVASFSEGQSEALLTIACLLQRRAGPVPGLESAESELDKKLNRFDTSGTPLVERGDGWSYHDGEPFGDASWATPDFDDTFWAVDEAPLGHGADGLATETKPGATLYLRRYFDIADPTALHTLRATPRGNAKIVALVLNGKACELGALAADVLVEGSNTLAVAAAAERGDGGLLFDLELTANLPSAAHHLATVTDSQLGTAIGKYWGVLPETLRASLLPKAE